MLQRLRLPSHHSLYSPVSHCPPYPPAILRRPLAIGSGFTSIP